MENIIVMDKVQYKMVETKQDLIEFLRDEEIRALRIESESAITGIELHEDISTDRRSPRLVDVLYNIVYEDCIFNEVEDLEFDDVVEILLKVTEDGLVYYKQSVEFITIYELGELTGEIGTVPSMDEDVLYVPYLSELEYAYDAWVILKDVLHTINPTHKHPFDHYTNVYLDLIEDELYGYVDRYCRGYYGM